MNARQMGSRWVVLLAAAAMLGGCTAAQKGAGIGTAGGVLAGAVIGHQSGHRNEGALIGGAVVALGGYAVGNEMDKKKTQRELDAAKANAAIAANAANTITVNVRNTNGSLTPVVLRRAGNVWIGPKGEQYLDMPTEEQLRKVYGF